MARIDYKSRWGADVSGAIEVNRYTHGGGIALEMWTMEEDGYYVPWAFMTVNLAEKAKEGCAYLDTNNFPETEEIMEEYGLGEPTGRFGFSGFCVYPEYRLNLDEIGKYGINEEAA